jgi:hypothetical protein
MNSTLWNRLAIFFNNRNARRAREAAFFDLISSQNHIELALFLHRWPKMNLDIASSDKRPANPAALAAVSAFDDTTAYSLLRLLLSSKHPPNINVRWYDSNGTKHTVLSKLLILKYYKSAELVLSSGASPDVLTATDILSASHFNPDVVSWLIHHTNTTPSQFTTLFTTDTLCRIIQECALRVMYTQFHLQMSQTEKRAKQTILTRNACVCTRRLVAAGVHPIENIFQQGFKVVHPSFTERPEFQDLAAAATTPIEWCQQMNLYFPTEVKEGIRMLLMMNNRWKRSDGEDEGGGEGLWLDEYLMRRVCEQLAAR